MGCSRYSPRMGFKTLSFFCPVLGGPPGEAGSALLRRADRYGVSCRRRTGSSVSLVGSPLESGVSPAHIGPCNACHRAAPETTPLWRLFLIKLSLSLSLSRRGCCIGPGVGQWNSIDFYIHVTPYPLRGKGGRREIFGPAGGSVTLIG